MGRAYDACQLIIDEIRGLDRSSGAKTGLPRERRQALDVGPIPRKIIDKNRDACPQSKVLFRRRLAEAAEERGHVYRILNALRCTMTIRSHRPFILYDGETLAGNAILFLHESEA
ncbi:MAG: hypothetical protein ABJF89_07880 [Parasphingorhabdus sp.]|uniref:hypothetical protein n=1 Tax=Parasphingorhabdus sp. TaxID=2709688 RepID=UPI00326753B1